MADFSQDEADVIEELRLARQRVAALGLTVGERFLEGQRVFTRPVPERIVREKPTAQCCHRTEVNSDRGRSYPGCLKRDDAATTEHVQDDRRTAGVLLRDHACQVIERPALALDGVVNMRPQGLVIRQKGGEHNGTGLSDGPGGEPGKQGLFAETRSGRSVDSRIDGGTREPAIDQSPLTSRAPNGQGHRVPSPAEIGLRNVGGGHSWSFLAIRRRSSMRIWNRWMRRGPPTCEAGSCARTATAGDVAHSATTYSQ